MYGVVDGKYMYCTCTVHVRTCTMCYVGSRSYYHTQCNDGAPGNEHDFPLRAGTMYQCVIKSGNKGQGLNTSAARARVIDDARGLAAAIFSSALHFFNGLTLV